MRMESSECALRKCDFNVNHFHLILCLACTRKSHWAILLFSFAFLVYLFFCRNSCEMRSCQRKYAVHFCSIVGGEHGIGWKGNEINKWQVHMTCTLRFSRNKLNNGAELRRTRTNKVVWNLTDILNLNFLLDFFACKFWFQVFWNLKLKFMAFWASKSIYQC